jgi:hypothetical protein
MKFKAFISAFISAIIVTLVLVVSSPGGPTINWPTLCTAGTAMNCSTFTGAFNRIQNWSLTKTDLPAIGSSSPLATQINFSTMQQTAGYQMGYTAGAPIGATSACILNGGWATNAECVTDARVQTGDLYVESQLFAGAVTVPAASLSGDFNIYSAGSIFTSKKLVADGSVYADGNGFFGAQGRFGTGLRVLAGGASISGQTTINPGGINTLEQAAIGGSVCSGLTKAQCDTTQAAYPNSVTAVGGMAAGNTQHGTTPGQGPLFLKWKALRGYMDGSSPTSIATGITTIFSVICFLNDSPGSGQYWSTTGLMASAAYQISPGYDSSTGEVRINAGSLFEGTNIPYKCLVFYE